MLGWLLRGARAGTFLAVSLRNIALPSLTHNALEFQRKLKNVHAMLGIITVTEKTAIVAEAGSNTGKLRCMAISEAAEDLHTPPGQPAGSETGAGINARKTLHFHSVQKAHFASPSTHIYADDGDAVAVP